MEPLGTKAGSRSKKGEVTANIVPSVGKPCRMASGAKGPLGYLAALNKSQKPRKVPIPGSGYGCFFQ